MSTISYVFALQWQLMVHSIKVGKNTKIQTNQFISYHTVLKSCLTTKGLGEGAGDPQCSKVLMEIN